MPKKRDTARRRVNERRYPGAQGNTPAEETSAAFARRLGVSRARVTQLKALGLPVLPNGNIPVERALDYIGRNKAPQAGAFMDRGIARVIEGQSRRKKPTAPPQYEIVGEAENPFDQGAIYMALRLAYAAEHIVASMAVGSGASMKVAYAVAKAAQLGIMQEAEDDMVRLGVEPARSLHHEGDGIWTLGASEPVNWPALAERAGEPVDFKAWEAYCRERWSEQKKPDSK